jgi:hypothetical protein
MRDFLPESVSVYLTPAPPPPPPQEPIHGSYLGIGRLGPPPPPPTLDGFWLCVWLVIHKRPAQPSVTTIPATITARSPEQGGGGGGERRVHAGLSSPEGEPFPGFLSQNFRGWVYQ